MTPARWFFDKHEQEPTTEVAIRRAPGEDVYIVLAGYDVATQSATYAVTINPLVNWIWFGFGVLALGTGIALLPERAFALRGAPACPRGPSREAVAPAAPAAGAGACAEPTVVPQDALRKQLEGDFMCPCGAAGPL